MALKRIGLSNFKAFKSFQQVDISPVSLLFGYNNSGKSSILRAVLLLADSFKKSEVPMYQSSILDYTSESIRGASHVELAHNNKPGMSFTLSWEDGSSVRFKVFQNGLDAEVIQEIEVQQFGCSYLFLQSLDADAPIGTYILQDSAEEVEMTVKDFRLDCEKVDFSHINQLIEAFSKSVYYLSSTRKYPPREFEIGIGVPLSTPV
ncbi:hypothetical protein CTH30272_03436 [Allocatenococcus thiocycli]|nr:hypothetical protein CTH30272_03436 [Catenococcus thiocycli]